MFSFILCPYDPELRMVLIKAMKSNKNDEGIKTGTVYLMSTGISRQAMKRPYLSSGEQ